MIILSIKSFGQKLQDIKFKDLAINQAKFEGGENELKKFFAMNLRYPMDLNYGTMIGIVIIDQEKEKLNTLTFNSPGKSYDAEFKRVVKLSQNKWIKNDSLDILYSVLTLDFSYEGSNYFVDYDHQPEFITGNIFLKNFSDNKLNSDEDLISSLNESYKGGEYKKVLKLTDELIKRNPFYPNFYVMRIKALEELGKDSSEEKWVITEFLNRSLE